MDLVDFSEARFHEIVNAYRPIAAHLGLPGVTAIPLSARDGDNVIAASTAMPWYDGPSLLQHLETVVPPDRAAAAARLPVRSEEHTSELQSQMRSSYAVLCLEKKKHKRRYHPDHQQGERQLQ